MEKEVKNSKKENKNYIITKDVNRVIKLVSYITAFFASIFAIIVFVFGIITTFTVANASSNEIIQNNFVTTFISNVSNTTMEETKISLLTMGSKFSYITFHIVLPTIALVCGAILLILLSYLILKFFNDSLTEKKLFNTKKLKQLENIINIFSVVLFITWALFNRPSMPFILLIYVLLFTIYHLFKKCIECYTSK